MIRLKTIVVLTCLAALPALADEARLPVKPNAAWQEECASCHLAYPPSLLSAQNWRQMMQGLDRHFGANAGLDAKTRDEILAFLERNASTRWGRNSAESLRITDTPWFRRKHDEVPQRVWTDPKVKSAANCAACHRGAAQGNYDEDDLALPVVAGRLGR